MSETLQRLDDKYEFAAAAEALGLRVPKSYRITNPQQVIDFDFSDAQRPIYYQKYSLRFYSEVRPNEVTLRN
jgi:hypothetical protein